MRPQTRSQNTVASSSKEKLPHVASNGDEVDSDEDDLTLNSIENHLTQLRKYFRKLKGEVTDLRSQKDELVEELSNAREEAAENEAQPKRGKKAGPSVASLQKEIAGLKARIEKHEKTERKDKKLIRQLQQKELKREADDLQEDGNDALEADDSAYQLRRLLRRFSDLMSANSLAGGEDCPICFEPLKVDDTVSFPCQHLLCEDCYNKLTPDSDEVKCPACRREWPRDEIEVVRYMATTQWDELLKVARKFAVIDHRGAQDTSEEEEEEAFLTEEQSEPISDSIKSEEPLSHILSSSPEPQEAPLMAVSDHLPKTPRKQRLIATPDATSEVDVKEEPDQEPQAGSSNGLAGEPSYTQSPAAAKRRKLELLAETRAQKRQRL